LICYSCFLAHLQAARSPSTISPDFMAMLRSGDARQLRGLLEHGASPNARDPEGNTALMLAAMYGDVPPLGLLLDKGADVNATNNAGATALMRAADNFSKVHLLVERGANVNARSGFGNTALMLAARPANSHQAVQLLLSRGADARATNYFGSTALMAAAAGGDEKSVRLLLKNGVDVNAQPTADKMGFILGGSRSALMWAAFRGDTAMTKLLIEAGANVNAACGLGTTLAQAAWADQTATAQILIQHGARVNQGGPMDGFTPLHWAASSEEQNASLVKLLLEHQANPNLGAGENVDAFLGTLQTPLMLSRRRGETPIVVALTTAGATNATPDRVTVKTSPARQLPNQLDPAILRAAIARALPPLQETSIKSKEFYVRHASHQDCTSCHQQYLPLAAVGSAKKQHIAVDEEAEKQLVKMVLAGELKNSEIDWEALFHPDASYTKGYELFSLGAAGLPPDASSDAWVHHLSVIQGPDGRWYNNLPRPPIQTGDLGATALAVHGLQLYSPPGQKAQLAKQVERARKWLWKTKPDNNSERIYQLLGLAWAGEPPRKLQSLAKALIAEQHKDGGWSQLPTTSSDAYATAQALYALRTGAGIEVANPSIDRGLRFLLETQLEDGTWHVRHRAFPFQPTTIQSGFPHGRDAWISAAATSWAVMALSVPERDMKVALGQGSTAH